MDSDFESAGEGQMELPQVQKRKRNLLGSSPRGKEAVSFVDRESSVENATDLEASGAEDSRWDISRLKANLPKAMLSSSTPTSRVARATPSLPRKMKHYRPAGPEEMEHEDLEVLNESPVGDCEAETNEDLPCRTLDNFVVFDQECKNLVVELDELGIEGTDITVSGNVEPLKAADMDGVASSGQDAFDEDDEDDGDIEGDGSSCKRGTDSSACANEFAQRIRLSAILNYETYLTQNGQTEIWVRTCFAWYKLLNPHPGYMAVYSQLYKSVYIAHQAIEHAKTNPALSMAQFSRELRESPSDIVSRLTPITDNDIRKYRESIIEEIQICLESTDHLELLGAPLIQAICRTGGGQKAVKRAKTSSSSIQRGARTTGKSIAVGEPKHENPACITPLIASIAQGLYARHLLSVSHFDGKKEDPDATAAKEVRASKLQADAWKKRYTEGSKAKQWAEDAKGIVSLADLQMHAPVTCFQPKGVSSVAGSRLPDVGDNRDRYGEVLVELRASDETDAPASFISLKVGETVLINAISPMPGYDAGSLWETADDAPIVVSDSDAQGSNALVRAVQITSLMYSRVSERWAFHGRMLLPGRDTLLQEVALANEWYLVDSCLNYSIPGSIRGKIDMSFIPAQQDIDVDEWISGNRLFCRFWYDPSCGMFEDVNTHIQGIGERAVMWCRSCMRTKNEPGVKLGRIISGAQKAVCNTEGSSTATKRMLPEYLPAATINNIEYHVNDTVYILSEHSDQPFQIGYILRFFGGQLGSNKLKNRASGLRAEVQILKRVRVLPPSKRPPGDDREYDDERHLYWTPLMQEFDVSSFRGKCWVAHPDEISTSLTAYKDMDVDAFYARFESIRPWPSCDDDWIELKPARDPLDRGSLGDGEADEADERMPMSAPCPVCKHKRMRHIQLMTRFLASPSSGAVSTVVSPAADMEGALVPELPDTSPVLPSAFASPAAGDVAPAAEPAAKGTSFMRGRQPLRALDLFSGCGGLTQGMDQSGVVKTLWSVEYMPSAGFTFSKNHPYAQVYNQCSNLLLDWAIKTHRGVSARPLINKFDGKELPPMPQPGDVDFIYCGPPCQGFSRCNRFIKADDIKTSLIANALSYVDFYRPSYFLLENVRGLLNYRLGGVQVGPGRVKGGIEMGMLKFIMRALTTMGYQARFYVLQAGNYGLAQSRRRLFIWACKRGCKLPGVPRPVTTFEKSNQTNVNLPDGITYAPFADLNGNAPHHSISVEDAIGDLPKFEFVNPALVYPEDEQRNVDWPQYIAVSGQPTDVPGDLNGSCGYVGSMEMLYSNPPRSEFQRLRRRQNQMCLPSTDGSYGDLIVTLHNHVSRKFNAINVERICRVVMEPGKDHSSLPEKLKPWCLSAKESAASRNNGWKGLYGRVNPKGYFGTALTEMSPMGKSGTVLLYDQRRVLSVRECARAQGFPDKFRLYSIKENDTRDMHRQIGNAVPPPLAFALSLELRQALFRDFVDNLPDEECMDGADAILGDACVDLSLKAQPRPELPASSLSNPSTVDSIETVGLEPDGLEVDDVAFMDDDLVAGVEDLAATC